MQTRHGGACGGEGGERHRHHHQKTKRMMRMIGVVQWRVHRVETGCCCSLRLLLLPRCSSKFIEREFQEIGGVFTAVLFSQVLVQIH